MVDIESYIEELIQRLKKQFGENLLYVGLQGSYLRGEATESSDIDIMVVLEELGVTELADYRSVICSLPYADRSCGFICGTEDLSHWNPLEICHLLHTTKDCFGCLAELVPDYTSEDVRNFVKMSINNLYHEICHRYIHRGYDRSREALPFTYKGTFFILQNLHYLRTGKFAATKAALLDMLEGEDHAVLAHSIALNSGADWDFDESFALLLSWCQETLKIL